MRNLIIVTLFIVIGLSDKLAFCAPTVESVTAQQGNSLSITGSGFGTKPAAAPYYFSTFDNLSTGKMPTGQVTNVTSFGTPQANRSHSGSKSLESDHCADVVTTRQWASTAYYGLGYYANYNSQLYICTKTSGWLQSSTPPPDDPINWQTATAPRPHCVNGRILNDYKRNAIDLGVSGSEKIFVSAWVYLDKGTTTNKFWQWKNFAFVSASSMYYNSSANETGLGYENWWDETGQRWQNGTTPIVQYWNNTIPKFISIGYQPPNDMWLWSQWQRVDFYTQRSGNLTANGIAYANRVGRSTPMVNLTNIITSDAGNKPWRYVDLNNGIESVYAGYVDLKVYMDDIYVDTTQARVELCDTSTWPARTHCEIQPATAWADGQVTANVNPGTFGNGQTVYIYVVDANGAVNSTGTMYTIGSLPPTAPKNVTGTPGI